MITGVKYKAFKYPVGELHVELEDLDGALDFYLTFKFERMEEIFELLLVCDAIKRVGGNIQTLEIPYMPFSREDRLIDDYHAFPLKVFANLINSIGAKEVVTWDAHSDVTLALFNNISNIEQHVMFSHLIDSRDLLVIPDAGACKKAYKVAQSVGCDVVQATKHRDVKTGEITKTTLSDTPAILDRNCVIVDDICDGGRTFVEIAKVLKDKGAKSVALCVTHGFFTKGLKVFDGLIDRIYTAKGKVK